MEYTEECLVLTRLGKMDQQWETRFIMFYDDRSPKAFTWEPRDANPCWKIHWKAWFLTENYVICPLCMMISLAGALFSRHSYCENATHFDMLRWVPKKGAPRAQPMNNSPNCCRVKFRKRRRLIRTRSKWFVSRHNVESLTTREPLEMEWWIVYKGILQKCPKHAVWWK